MANVSKLDTKHKQEFLRGYIPKHLGMTLTDINAEVRKRFGRGMDLGTISDERERVRHAKAMKEGTKKLRSETPTTITSMDRFSAMATALAAVMKQTMVHKATFTREGDGSVKISYEYETIEMKTVEKKL